MFKVIIHKRAARFFQKLTKAQKGKIKEALKKLEADPFRQPGVKQMVGNWDGYYRFRIGNIRIIFWINQTENMIYVDHIGFRGDIYKS